MSAAETRKTAARPSSSAGSVLRNGLWLAKRDIRSSWASFPATAIVSFLFGLLGAAQYRNALDGSTGTFFGQVVLDFFLLALVAAMSSNLLFNRDYFREISDESFNGRLSFIRSMPVSAKSVVLGRVAAMSLALTLAMPAFFLAPYLVYGGLRDSVGFPEYVWYFGMWLGYAILAIGVFVLSQFGFNWKLEGNWLPATVGVLALYGLVIAAANLLLDDGLSLTFIELATKTGGPLAAIFSIFVGTVALAACVSISAKRLEKRDIG